ncbi:MAG TPA: hypothetical protein PKD45_11000 [Flavobacteriales bacterium]|nr:hypothetical protein [Flavobacteriales bacterium]
MRYLAALATIAVLLASSGCNKDDDQGYRPAGISFRSDSGYTYLNDTVVVSDTLLIGAMVAEGSQRLRTVFVQMRVNGGAWVQKDSVPFTQNPMAIDVQAIMGNTPRTEEWSIMAVERSGNATRRGLTFTVVE